jgi:hypothetical protein
LKKTGLLFLLPALLAAGSVSYTVDFSPAELTFEKYQGYDVVSLTGQYHTSEPGRPLLPQATYQVLIPPDAEVTGVDVVSSTEEELSGRFRILPAQRPVPFSARSLPPFVEPDGETYRSAALYPDRIADVTKSGCLGGYRLASVSVTPLRYVPRTGKLVLATHVVLKVSYVEQVHPLVTVTPSQQALLGAEAAALVRNPEMLEVWAPRTAEARDGNEVDMIVVTSRGLASSFQPFADWKTKKGYKTLVLGTDSVYARYPGNDNQAKIRNCVIDYWQNRGLKYLVLGGDAEIIPDRKCYLTVEGTTDYIPADMYYADLQYSWDSDHNGYYGEMTDSVDLYHDVYVGRVPADNVNDVATFIKKDTMFEKHPDTTYLKSLILPSEMLFDPYHGKVANNIIASGFPTGWKTAKLEDPPYDATPDSLRRGYEFGHICCHGNYDLFGSILDISQVPSITCGNKTSIINSIACLTGEFDDQECIAEELVNFSGGASVATLCNSRYGYGYPPALGPSELIDIEFYRQLNTRGCFELGPMNALSKDYYHGLSMNQEVWRWCIYELTLFGDPSMPVWTERPAAMSVSYNSSIPTAPQTMRVNVTRAGQPLADARVCLTMGSQVYAVGRTNSLGWIDLFISPTTTGTMNVTVTAHNCRPFEGTCSVVSGSNQPAITFQSLRVSEGGNGRLDPGEAAQLLVTLRNSGNAQATGLNGVLRTTCSHVAIIDSLDSYGTLAAGDSNAGSGYQVLVAPNAPQGTVAEFYVHAAASEGTWEPFFTAVVGEQPDRKVWADHDTGNCILSATSMGSVGTLGPYGEGSGFKYPRNSAYGSLYCASFMAGTDSGYVVDRFYSHPSTTVNDDWRIVDTLQRASPPECGAQEYQAAYDDGNHPRARGLKVEQWSASNKQPAYDDFVIFRFDMWNYGSSPITGLYAGVMADFDVYNVQSNAVRSDTARRLTYMYDPAGMGEPYVGIRLLSPATFANQSAIKNSQYIAPGSMMNEAVKDSFLRGAIRVRNSTSTSNWSEVVSAGPFDVPVNWYQRVAFAFVGGESDAEIKTNSDSAQSWWNRNSGVENSAQAPSLKRRLLEVEPSLARDRVEVSYSLGTPGVFALRVYDLCGKLVATLREGTSAQGRLTWEPRGIGGGVYFVRLEAVSGSETAKIVLQP